MYIRKKLGDMFTCNKSSASALRHTCIQGYNEIPPFTILQTN